MGVNGLWRLLLPIGRRISIETLEGKILVIDASIWLTQFLKAMRDPDTGRVQAAAHLIGFFRRLCRLRFHGIRPILVFDGPTPEIKQREIQNRRRRREQFATLGDASLQRLAKRLLAQNLKNQKTTSSNTASNGAFAAGFNPGAQENQSEVVVSESKEGDRKPAANQDPPRAAVEEVVDQEEQDEDVNDWDAPIKVDGNGSDQGDEQDDSDGDEWLADDANYVDVNLLFSLPANKRKDAIEKAKRQQRLQSRQQFMPAAANPHQFSQVQLNNFLRSTRLNQSIEAAAKKAVEQDNQGQPGEVMASDRRIRVTLEREEEDTKIPAKRKGRIKFTHEDSSSEEEEWEETHQPAARRTNAAGAKKRNSSSPVVAATRKPRRVIEDDTTSESEADDEVLDSKPAARPNQLQDVIALDHEDDSSEGGGFLKAIKESRASSVPSTAKAVINIGDSDSDSEGGGFLKSNGETHSPGEPEEGEGCYSITRQTSIEAQDRNQASDLPSSHLGSTDEAVAQEIEDRLLAQALQAAEDEEATKQERYINADFRYLPGNSSVKEKSEGVGVGVDDADESVCAVSYPNNSSMLQEQNMSTTNAKETAKSSDEEGIDWEEGEDAKDEEEVSGGVASRSLDLFSYDEDTGRNRDGFRRLPTPAHASDVEEDPELSTSPKITENIEEIDIIAGSATASAEDTHQDEATKQEAFSAETAAALERAQATASNLANWAGRVFRRAVKEANQSSPQKSGQPGDTDAIGNSKHIENSGNAPSSDEEFAIVPQPKRSASLPKRAERVDAEPSDRQGEKTTTSGSQPAGRVADSAASEETASMLAQYGDKWTAERNQRERDMDTVTDEMKEEVIQLLQLFGVPYIEAPAEAEAQCAALEELGLVDGIVTEDSDVFVFGGKTVYKNIFDEKLYAECYLAQDAEKEMALGRNAMVALAMLLGCDYTEGVKGVGIVNSMEVLQAFDVSESLKDGLEMFKKWLDGIDPCDPIARKDADTEQVPRERDFHVKHRTARTRWVAPDSFPSDGVMHAFLNPVVDKSTESFSWGLPDVEGLVLFCTRHMGWRPEETERLVEPVVAKVRDKYRQTRLDSFMRYEDGIKFANVRSKRLREVLDISSEDKKEREGSKSKRRKKSNPL